MNNTVDSQYIELVSKILTEGVEREDRTGVGTIGLFGHQMRFDLSKGFPMLTTKKVHWKSVAYELLWFLSGDTNVKWLQDNGVTIWDEWADESGDLGPVYGKQWRNWQTNSHVKTVDKDGHDWYIPLTIDQIAKVIDQLQTNPYGRRHIVSAWNPADVPNMALPPCHLLFQFHVTPPKNEGERPKLSCQLYQRSVDVGLGLPFNIASYALLTHMIAAVCNMDVGDFVHTSGDVHIYTNHVESLMEQLAREPFELPVLNIRRAVTDIDDFRFEDFELVGYKAHPNIKMKVAV